MMNEQHVVTQLTTLSALGAKFGCGRGKRPQGKDWQRRPYSLTGALRRRQDGLNVGLVAGRLSGNLIVLDLDAGADRLRNHPIFGRTLQVYRDDAPERVKAIVKVIDRLPSSRKAHDAGVELISSGGYAVLDGEHPDGGRYQMTDKPVIAVTFDQVAAVWKEWTGETLQATGLSPVRAQSADELLQTAIATARPGNRNRTGFDLARQLRDIGMSESQAAGVLLTYVAHVGRTGDHEYTQSESMQTLKAVFRRRARRSYVDAVLDGLEAAIVGTVIELPVNVRKTAIAVVAIMRESGKLEDVGLSLRELAQRTGIPKSTVARHLLDLVDRFDVLTLTRCGNYSRASEYALTDRARACAKMGHPNAVGVTPAGGVPFWHKGRRDTQIEVYRSLQAHPLTAPGARVHPQLAEVEKQLHWTFGAGSQAILAALAQHGVSTLAALMHDTAISKRTLHRRLMTLVDAGLVVRSDARYRLADGWQERANELAPALTTFGRLELRAWMGAKNAVGLHSRMARLRNGANRRIAEEAAERAQGAVRFWEAQKDERNRERRAYGLALGMNEADIPPISLIVGKKERRVMQPFKVSKEGRKVIPTGEKVRTGKGGGLKRERLAALLRKGLLLADEAAEVRQLATELGVSIESQIIRFNEE